MSTAPSSRVEITESSTRDGLQSLAADISAADKAGLIDALAEAGLQSFDAVSFVSPRAVPQMADAEAVVAAVGRRDDVTLGGLVPNLRGLDRALASGIDEVAVLTAASDKFSVANTGTDSAGALERAVEILKAVEGTGLATRAYVSTALDCPYEGPIDSEVTTRLASALYEAGVDRVFVGDTLGLSTAPRVETLLGSLAGEIPVGSVGVHFHDTYGQAIANTVVAIEHGVTAMDASAGGLGGCPYAPGASGNVATEDLMHLLDGLGIETGIDRLAVARAAFEFCSRHGLTYNSRAGRATMAASERRE